jgi:hypothetical protein
MSHTNAREEAIGYLLAHQAEHLHHDRNLLVHRCASYLRDQHGLSNEAAATTAMQALGELDARATNAHVDMERSTSFAIFVIDPVSGLRTVFTAGDLVRLARARASHRCGALH